VRIYHATQDEVVPAIEFIAEDGDEAVRRDTNDYGGVETVNYRHLEHTVRTCCTSACTAAEIARTCGVPVNSVLALLARLVAEGVLHPVTESGKPGRLYTAAPVDPAWSAINRRLLDHMKGLGNGIQPPRRVGDSLVESGLATREADMLELTPTGMGAVEALTKEDTDGCKAGKD
jgi:predicted ArsR family transcriptional regulator